MFKQSSFFSFYALHALWCQIERRGGPFISWLIHRENAVTYFVLRSFIWNNDIESCPKVQKVMLYKKVETTILLGIGNEFLFGLS